MDGGCNCSSTTSSLRPKSPLPGLVDFHGKRKQMVKIQVLEREIGLLQDELKSLEDIHPASRCCKELDAFVGSISDPLTSTKKQTISESHHFRKHFCLSWVCCRSNCALHKKMGKACCSWRCSSSDSKCCCGSRCLKTVSSYVNCCCRCSE